MSHTIGYLTIDQKGRTTLPQQMRKQLGITEGTQLRVDQTAHGTFEIIPSVVIPQDQLWYHGRDGRDRLGRAEEDFATGRSTQTRGEKETQRHLDSLKTGALKRPSRSR